ncbi:MAG: hypothetical protein PWQ67_1743 [Clostridia bacterium]|jgi:5'-deoxynucleotidase YfbR-like HD superfamily hydrolase|nr:hypothetical protein [Clostridia bacterium]
MDNRLSELKNRKKEYLQDIYEITLKQKEALKIDDLDELQKLINEKQNYINKINQIDLKLNDLERENQQKSPEHINVILKTIQEIDTENKQMAYKNLLAIKKKIGKVRQGKKVHKAYNPTIVQSAFFNKSR